MLHLIHLVSIHARHCWRANRSGAAHSGGLVGVSIHARHCWRANPAHGVVDGQAIGFQSTPAIAGGRIRPKPPAWPPPSCFNPRPPLLAGESSMQTTGHPWHRCFNPRPPLLAGESHRAHLPILGQVVSIHARHCWRANREVVAAGALDQASFNPRPPLLAGESTGCRNSEIREAVSIHARHCWRANRYAPGEPGYGPAVSIHARHCWRANRCRPATLAVFCLCFNPRPPLLAGESGQPIKSPWGMWFQSTPAIAGGRIAVSRRRLSGSKSFNPRPPLLAGESLRM